MGAVVLEVDKPNPTETVADVASPKPRVGVIVDVADVVDKPNPKIGAAVVKVEDEEATVVV